MHNETNTAEIIGLPLAFSEVCTIATIGATAMQVYTQHVTRAVIPVCDPFM